MTVSPHRQRHVAEQIAETKRIMLAIRNALPHKDNAVVLLTSALPGEGKSLAASGIASAAAQDVGRVLVLDMNWFRPSLHEWFDMAPWFELEELQQVQSVTRLVKPSGIENLDVLAAPRGIQSLTRTNGNTLELARSMVGQCSQEYNLLVIDAAPVFPTNRCMMDPMALAALCDGVAMVVRADHTPRQDVKRAQKVLESGGARILGIILNHSRDSRR